MYSIKKVSEMVGIPAVTIRAWENRYQIIAPVRSEGGHRLYSESDIEVLKWLKDQVYEKQVKIGNAVRLLTQSPISPAAAPSQSHATDALIDQLYDSLMEFNIEQSQKIMDLAFTLYDYEFVFFHVLVPVLYRIGDEWERGLISIAQEHFSSQIILQRCLQFWRILPVHPKRPKVLAFCPEGEEHQLGLMLFGLFLRKKGCEVIYLGPNMPVEGLPDIIQKKQITLIAISVTAPASYRTIERWLREYLESHSPARIVIGGRGMKGVEPIDSKYITYLEHADWEEWYRSIYRE